MPSHFLNGLRILDLSRLLPGPYCTRLLADLGADVIKVESPVIGDHLRSAPPGRGFEGMFDALNHGKRCLGLNYRHPLGRELLLRLASEADVLVESFRPGAMARWELGEATLRAANPRLICVSLSGYGQAGPYRDRAGHDLNYIAVAGLLGFGRLADEAPALPRVQIADLASGMLGALHLLAALWQRERTGAGAYLDVSLVDGPLSWLAAMGAFRQLSDGAATRLPPLAGGLPCYNAYATADGEWVTLAALEVTFWGDFCQATGREDLIAKQLEPGTAAELEALFKTRTRAEWLELLGQVDACLELAAAPAEAAAHPQVQLRSAALGLDHAACAPALGAHTSEILHELGLSDAELEALQAKHVIRLA